MRGKRHGGLQDALVTESSYATNEEETCVQVMSSILGGYQDNKSNSIQLSRPTRKVTMRLDRSE